MKVIVSDFQADCITTGQRETRKKTFQNIDARSSPKNHRLNCEQLALTASPEEEAISFAIIPRFISAKLASSSHHCWPAYDFGGHLSSRLYDRSAVGCTLKYFERWQKPVTPRAFGGVTEQAIPLRNHRTGAVA
ncbi:MAG: hypothetical protein DCF25_06615 [Leptolyngbya foveolarum]|uniref:Uncharacterized protein n=1 Tax=Leptolyngbya foveolarum TaxID=47253 RepID=A0A2W4UMC0_9CYAN|nr:MAG: hypothetical protein DCF25_06615 [Leptolyngbya foveolarum]